MATKNDISVQGTNDCSILSKHAMCHAGYAEDRYLEIFTQKKAPRRAPLINRGYYIRSHAIRFVLEEFVRQEGKKQIISLGAGFDTAYFRLRDTFQKGDLMKSLLFIEVDFSTVADSKLHLLRNSSIYMNVFPPGDLLDTDTCSLSTPYYKLLGADLNDTENFHRKLEQCVSDFGIPTLFLSECSMTYMQQEASSALIKLCSDLFPNSLFVTYEQVRPCDAFGSLMRSHFSKLNSALKSVEAFPDELQQIARYVNCGFHAADAFTMLQYFATLDQEERDRVFNLEYFDEFEEWCLKCNHYIMLLAWKSTFTLPKVKQKVASMSEGSDWNKTVYHSIPFSAGVSCDIMPDRCDIGCQRYAHAATLTVVQGHTLLLVHGGFGESKGKHLRLDAFAGYRLDHGGFQIIDVLWNGMVTARLHHTLTSLDGGKVFMFGGRESPAKSFNETVLLHLNMNSDKLEITVDKDFFHPIPDCEGPSPRWRHTATRVLFKGAECVIIIGGRAVGSAYRGKVEDSAYIWNMDTRVWTAVPPIPGGGRHSHAACLVDGDSKLLVTGGLDENELVVANCLLLDIPTMAWSSVFLPYKPCYSHTMHALHSTVLSLGGIGTCGQPMPLQVIDIQTKRSFNRRLPSHLSDDLVMFFNHCSNMFEHDSNLNLVVTGGGGNCFSFGTHFNTNILMFNLNRLLT